MSSSIIMTVTPAEPAPNFTRDTGWKSVVISMLMKKTLFSSTSLLDFVSIVISLLRMVFVKIPSDISAVTKFVATSAQ